MKMAHVNGENLKVSILHLSSHSPVVIWGYHCQGFQDGGEMMQRDDATNVTWFMATFSQVWPLG